MTIDRVTRMVGRLDLGDRPLATLSGLCTECADEFDVDGAGISLIVGGEHRGSLGASSPHASQLEELQVTCAEGPCLDAHNHATAVAEPDLASSSRWKIYTPAALGTGVRAVFAFPLQVGSARYGALDLYRNAPGPLSVEDLRDAGAIAGLVTTLVLLTQAGAPPGSLPDAIDQMMDHKSVVHQAAGMVSAQLGVCIEDANVALRARAYAAERPLQDLAEDIVARRLRLEL